MHRAVVCYIDKLGHNVSGALAKRLSMVLLLLLLLLHFFASRFFFVLSLVVFGVCDLCVTSTCYIVHCVHLVAF